MRARQKRQEYGVFLGKSTLYVKTERKGSLYPAKASCFPAFFVRTADTKHDLFQLRLAAMYLLQNGDCLRAAHANTREQRQRLRACPFFNQPQPRTNALPRLYEHLLKPSKTGGVKSENSVIARSRRRHVERRRL
jgi:hypothetical protein